MKAMVSGATTTVRQLLDEGYSDVLGCLRVPGESVTTLPDGDYPGGLDWIMDNGCFHGPDFDKIQKMLVEICRLPEELQPNFIVPPDVVCDWEATIDAFWQFIETLDEWFPLRPFMVAVVLQDGIDLKDDRWHHADHLFVGGSDHDFKLKYCEPILQEAHEMGMWVHVGRINSHKMIRRMWDMGCVNSFDGSGYSKWPDANLVPAVKFLRSLNHEGRLF